MAKALRVPITPAVLTWMIEECCVDRTKLCERVGISEVFLGNLERGIVQPTKEIWHKLAETLRRPTAAFLLPGVPSHEALTKVEDFRSAVDDLFDGFIADVVALASSTERDADG